MVHPSEDKRYKWLYKLHKEWEEVGHSSSPIKDRIAFIEAKYALKKELHKAGHKLLNVIKGKR